MARGRILVINPNSSDAVTRGIDAALAKLRLPGGPVIDVCNLAEGPPGIATQADVEQVVQPICALVRRDDADAFVIACFSDPGLHAAREAASGRTVLGIAECGVLRALTLGERFGIVALSPASVRRQRRAVRGMGLDGRYAGSRPANLEAAASAASDAFAPLRAAGATLRDADGADVLVLGCAGMAEHRRGLELALGLPVVEPSQAAVAVALGAVCLRGA